MNSEPCPHEETLKAYLCGALAPQLAANLEPHLEECSDCAQRIDVLEQSGAANDPVAMALRHTTANSKDDTAVDSLIRRLMNGSPRAEERPTRPESSGADRPRRDRLFGAYLGDRAPHTPEQLLERCMQEEVIEGDHARAELAAFIQARNAREAADVVALARWLVDRDVLTMFQACALCRGQTLRLGEFQLHSLAGSGGMGHVFRARHIRLQRDTALKVVLSADEASDDAKRRFEREIRTLARLDHPNIVAAYDASEANGLLFLAMEHVDGVNLQQLVQSSGPLAPAAAIHVIAQAARGLTAAHAEAIVHRDIKPSNLLLRRDGVVKLSDLGLAKIVAQEIRRDDSSLTATGLVVGTLDYISPEQAMGADANEPADIYSLGWTLRFLLTGEPPFPDAESLQKLNAHQTRSAPQLDGPPSLNALFQRMVSKDASERPDCSEVVASLESIHAQLAESPPTDADRTDPLQVLAAQIESPTSTAAAAAEFEQLLEQRRAWQQEQVDRPAAAATKPLPRWRVYARAVLAVLILAALAAGNMQLGDSGSRRQADGVLHLQLQEADAQAIEIWVVGDDRVVAKLNAESGWKQDLPSGPYTLLLRRGGRRYSLVPETITLRPDAPVSARVIPRRPEAPRRDDPARRQGELGRLQLHEQINALEGSPDGRLLYAAGAGGTLMVIDNEQALVTHRFRAHRTAIQSMRLSPDGTELATVAASPQGRPSVTFWSTKDWSSAGAIRVPTHDIAYDPNSDKILVAVAIDPAANARPANSLILFNGQRRVALLLDTEPDIEYVSLACSPDGKFAAAGRSTGEVDVFDLETGKSKQQFRNHASHVRGVGFGGVGQLYSAGSDGKLVGRDLDSGAVLADVDLEQPLLGLTMHSDSPRILLRGRAAFHIFDVRNGRHATLHVPGHQGIVSGAVFLEGPSSLATSSWDRTVRYWRIP